MSVPIVPGSPATAEGPMKPAPSVGGGAAAPPSALAGVIARMKDYAGSIIKQAKPWNEVFDRTVISKPASLGDVRAPHAAIPVDTSLKPRTMQALTRIKKNAAYFRVNYLIVMVATTLATFVLNPTALMILAILAAAWVRVAAPLARHALHI